MPAWSDHTWPAAETPRRVAVLFTLIDDHGHPTKLLGFGPTVDGAAADAERKIRESTGDHSWIAVAGETV